MFFRKRMAYDMNSVVTVCVCNLKKTKKTTTPVCHRPPGFPSSVVCFSPLVFHRSPRLPLSSDFDCTSCHSSSTLSASFCWFSIVPLIYHCSLVIYPPLVCRSHPGLPSSPGLPSPHAPSSAFVLVVCRCPHGLPLSFIVPLV